MSRREKPIVITGAGGGIGKTLVNCLIGDFNYKCIVAVERSRAVIRFGESRAMEIGPRYETELFRDVVAREVGCPVWGLINLVGKEHPAVTFKPDFWEAAKDALEDNARTTAHMCDTFAPQMRVSGGGRIINISSVTAHRPTFGAGAYSASKAWVEGFTRALAFELAPKRVTANCIALGYFRSSNPGMFERMNEAERAAAVECVPMGRPGEVDEVAGLIDYLLSGEAEYMTGQTLHLNGGLYA